LTKFQNGPYFYRGKNKVVKSKFTSVVNVGGNVNGADAGVDAHVAKVQTV
jgi:hypothetical protein